VRTRQQDRAGGAVEEGKGFKEFKEFELGNDGDAELFTL
jgi:hypothetical protein